MNWQLLKEWGVQVFLALDPLLNVLIPPIDGTIGYADETLSARCYRAHRDSRWSACGKTAPSIGASFKGLQ